MSEYKKIWMSRGNGEFLEIGYIEYTEAPNIVRDMVYHDGHASYPIRNSNTVGQKLEDVIASNEASGWKQ